MRPHRRQPTRLPCPWDSPGKNTGVGCHFLLQCMKVKSEQEVAHSCLDSSDPMDCSLPGSSVHGIFQAKVLEWGAIAYSQNSLSLPCKWLAEVCPHWSTGKKCLFIRLWLSFSPPSRFLNFGLPSNHPEPAYHTPTSRKQAGLRVIHPLIYYQCHPVILLLKTQFLLALYTLLYK